MAGAFTGSPEANSSGMEGALVEVTVTTAGADDKGGDAGCAGATGGCSGTTPLVGTESVRGLTGEAVASAVAMEGAVRVRVASQRAGLRYALD